MILTFYKFEKFKESVGKFFFFLLLPQNFIRSNNVAMEHNGWGLTKFKKYQMKKIEKTFFKFCLSPCYLSGFIFFLCGGKK